jgi:hypothetical protein
MRPYLEKTHYKKRTGGVAQSVGPEFKSQYRKKKVIRMFEGGGCIAQVEDLPNKHKVLNSNLKMEAGMPSFCF